MLPWGHAAVGYLCYSFIVRVRDRRAPTGPAVLTLAVGTQLPDLIDKPLAWSLGILPSGRSLGHSLLFAVLLTIVVWVVAQRYDRQREVSALMVGHLLHVLADSTPFSLQAIGKNSDRYYGLSRRSTNILVRWTRALSDSSSNWI